MPPQEPATPPADQLSQIVERLRTASNILVTVSNNPSVDQLAACIGLTVALNKVNKHATAVFSGKVPSTLEFLQPDKTIETNTNSLRDFIISLDKSKADKLRYKVEDNVVKIFITPYRTSISDKDLEFTQGDFNVDAVIALGVRERSDLDGAIIAHGRILHDATVVSINNETHSELGSINWLDGSASSLCEMVSDILKEMDETIIDSQIATALLTGLVAETDRFGNDKATPHTMSVSGSLMAAGASPQLIATKLKEPEKKVEESVDPNVDAKEPASEDGEIKIDHNGAVVEDSTEKAEPKDEPEIENILIDESGKIRNVRDEVDRRNSGPSDSQTANNNPPTLVLDPPQLGGQLTANSLPEHQQYSPSTDPLSNTRQNSPILNRNAPITPTAHAPEPTPSLPPTPEPESPNPEPPEINDKQTLSEIEQALGSPHDTGIQQAAESVEPPLNPEPTGVTVPPPPPVEEILEEVEKAADQSNEQRLESLKGLGTTGQMDLHAEEPKSSDSSSTPPAPPVPPPMMPPPPAV